MENEYKSMNELITEVKQLKEELEHQFIGNKNRKAWIDVKRKAICIDSESQAWDYDLESLIRELKDIDNLKQKLEKIKELYEVSSDNLPLHFKTELKEILDSQEKK